MLTGPAASGLSDFELEVDTEAKEWGFLLIFESFHQGHHGIKGSG